MAQVKYPAQQMHRIAYTKLTEDQIADKLRPAAKGPSSASELSEVYAGKQIRILADHGPALSYRFAGKNRLVVSENGGMAAEAGYGALTLGDIVFFTHIIPGTQRGYHIIVDQHTNLATVFEVWFSGYKDNREVQRQAYYGCVGSPGRNHQRRGTLLPIALRVRATTGNRTTASKLWSLSVNGLFKLRRAHAPGRRTRLLRTERLRSGQRRCLYLSADRVRILRHTDHLCLRPEPAGTDWRPAGYQR